MSGNKVRDRIGKRLSSRRLGMTGMGQNRKSSRQAYVFRFTPKADSSRTSRHVRIVPMGDKTVIG
jgi:hypothetical protein